MKRFLATPLLLALAACGTPQERCIDRASHDIKVMDRLIARTEGNISRGYAYVETVEYMPAFGYCNLHPRKPGFEDFDDCERDVPTKVTTPVAINLAEEQAVLDSMRKRRAEKLRDLPPQIEACRATYPE